ncbi:MAG: hypothetical protein DWQ28_13295 [Proteobacteria bacterium]|nr:MAG: hypothetical protein DWQ28_13295 [Pseudomonadota bacterium]
MAVHLINQSCQIRNALGLAAEGDTVIITYDDPEAIAALANRRVKIALLAGSSLKARDIRSNEAYEIISESDWVKYTTSSESVISWG